MASNSNSKKSAVKDEIERLETELHSKPQEEETVARLALRLAQLYDQFRTEKNQCSANQYYFIAGQAYIRSGRLAKSLMVVDYLKGRPGAEEQVKLLKRWLVDQFSGNPDAPQPALQNSKKLKGDEHLPPPTPYQELKGKVAFTETSDVRVVALTQSDEYPLTQREQWQGSIKPSRAQLFTNLNSQEFEQLVDLAEMKILKPNETLFREGDEPSSFYIVCEGEMELETKRGLRKVFREGQFFGELALFSKSKRTATLKTRHGAKLLEFSEVALENVFFYLPSFREKIMSFYQYRLFFDAASRNNVFKGFSQSDLEEMTEYLMPIRVDAGKVLIDQGGASDSFYVIAKGHVQISQGASQICKLGPGHFLGEIGLILNRTRTATATCMTECLLLECQREDFNDLLKDFPKFKRLVEEVAKMRFSNDFDEITHEMKVDVQALIVD